MTSGTTTDALTPLEVTPKLRAFTKKSAVAVPAEFTGLKVSRSFQMDAAVVPVPWIRQDGRWQPRKPVPNVGATIRTAGEASAGGAGVPVGSTTEILITA